MFVDVYNLGRGSVSSVHEFCKFTINNLQVLRGYKLLKIPEAALKVACGPHGLWKPGDPPPMLEIVPHHQAPIVYAKLPEVWRTPHFQAAGTSRKLVPVTNPIEKAMLRGKDGYTLDMKVAPPAPADTPCLDDVLPGLMQRVASPELSTRPDQPALDAVKPPVPPAPEVQPRPSSSNLPDVRPRPTLAERQSVIEAAATAASDRCQGKTGSGASCPRRARPGSRFCGAHQPKGALT